MPATPPTLYPELVLEVDKERTWQVAGKTIQSGLVMIWQARIPVNEVVQNEVGIG